MDITWLGHACFRLRGKDGVLLMDPCDRSTGYALGKQQADVVTASRPGPEHAHVEVVTTPHRLLDAPGEYEIGGVLYTGVQTNRAAKSEDSDQPARNVAFVVQMDDLRICHLGGLDHTLKADLAEELSDIDVLLVPVGGQGSLDAPRAAEVISLLQPRLVVPMRYQTDGSALPLDPLDPFIKQMGQSAPAPQAKLTVTRASLPESTQVIVLDYRK
jgi:L-ascorbate metabolism protein UlaG (beta-lactamase superfamily)